jgi:hypothetical protein
MKTPRSSMLYRSSDEPCVNGRRAIVFPDLKLIAAPVLQNEMGGDKWVPQFFETCFWTPRRIEGAVMITRSEEDWRHIAKLWLDDLVQEKAKKAAHAKDAKSSFRNRPFEELLSSQRELL